MDKFTARDSLVKYNSNAKRPFIICFVLFVIFFILFNFSYTCSVWIFLILKPFMYGVSSFKINFFLVYTSILCSLFLLGGDFRIQRTIILFQRVNFTSIVLAALAGFWTFVSIVVKLQLPFGKYALHFKDYYHTINYFAHTHSTKVPMYFFVKVFNIEYLLEKFDTALPLAEYVDFYAVGFLTLFFLIALVSFFILVRPVIIRWERLYRFKIFLLYSFASCHILKSLIDGGPLSYGLWPSVIVIHILYHSNSIASLLATLKRYKWSYILAIILLCSFNTYVGRSEAMLQTLIGATFFICIYILFFLSMVVKRVRLTKIILTTIICCAYSFLYLYMHTVRDVEAFMQKIQKEDKVLYYNYPSLNTDIDSFSIINYSSEMLGKRVVDVYSELGENPFRNRNVGILKDGNAKKQEYNGYIFRIKVLKSRDIVTLPSNDYIKIHNTISLSQISKKDFLLQISFNSKFFPSLWEMNPSAIYQNNKYAMLFYLNYYFASHGITEYVIIPYYYREMTWQ